MDSEPVSRKNIMVISISWLALLEGLNSHWAGSTDCCHKAK